MTTKTLMTLRGSDRQREILAARLATKPTAGQILTTKAAPAVEVAKVVPAAKVVAPIPPPAPRPLNAAEIAGGARREAEWARKHRVALVRESLIARFPAAFRPPGEPWIPLAIGIHRSVFEVLPEASRKDIARMLGGYTRDPEYRAALVEGTVRVGLDGQAAGVVTAAEVGGTVAGAQKEAP